MDLFLLSLFRKHVVVSATGAGFYPLPLYFLLLITSFTFGWSLFLKLGWRLFIPSIVLLKLHLSSPILSSVIVTRSASYGDRVQLKTELKESWKILKKCLF